MSLVADRQCWEIVDDAGLNWCADEDFLPHYRSRAEAAERIAELHEDRDLSIDAPLILRTSMCNGGRVCVRIRCNGCGEEFEDDGGADHFDPGDQVHIAEYIGYSEWQTHGDRHYCADCAPTDELPPAFIEGQTSLVWVL